MSHPTESKWTRSYFIPAQVAGNGQFPRTHPTEGSVPADDDGGSGVLWDRVGETRVVGQAAFELGMAAVDCVRPALEEYMSKVTVKMEQRKVAVELRAASKNRKLHYVTAMGWQSRTMALRYVRYAFAQYTRGPPTSWASQTIHKLRVLDDGSGLVHDTEKKLKGSYLSLTPAFYHNLLTLFSRLAGTALPSPTHPSTTRSDRPRMFFNSPAQICQAVRLAQRQSVTVSRFLSAHIGLGERAGKLGGLGELWDLAACTCDCVYGTERRWDRSGCGTPCCRVEEVHNGPSAGHGSSGGRQESFLHGEDVLRLWQDLPWFREAHTTVCCEQGVCGLDPSHAWHGPLLYDPSTHPSLLLLARLGVPAVHRRRLWLLLSGGALQRSAYDAVAPSRAPATAPAGSNTNGRQEASAAMQAALRGSYYARLVQIWTRRGSSYDTEIKKDVCRTFQRVPQFSTQLGGAQLARILGVYALHNPRLGYCQSLANLLACLVYVTQSQHNRNSCALQDAAAFRIETDIFWIFVGFVDCHIGYYGHSLCGVSVDQDVFDVLLQYYQPDLHEYLKQACFPSIKSHLFTVSQFLCMFVSAPVPLCVIALLWDTFFLYGSSALFAFGLTLLHLQRKDVLKHRDAGVILQLLMDGKRLKHQMMKKNRGYSKMQVYLRALRSSPDLKSEEAVDSVVGASQTPTRLHLPVFGGCVDDCFVVRGCKLRLAPAAGDAEACPDSEPAPADEESEEEEASVSEYGDELCEGGGGGLAGSDQPSVPETGTDGTGTDGTGTESSGGTRADKSSLTTADADTEQDWRSMTVQEVSEAHSRVFTNHSPSTEALEDCDLWTASPDFYRWFARLLAELPLFDVFEHIGQVRLLCRQDFVDTKRAVAASTARNLAKKFAFSHDLEVQQMYYKFSDPSPWDVLLRGGLESTFHFTEAFASVLHQFPSAVQSDYFSARAAHQSWGFVGGGQGSGSKNTPQSDHGQDIDIDINTYTQEDNGPNTSSGDNQSTRSASDAMPQAVLTFPRVAEALDAFVLSNNRQLRETLLSVTTPCLLTAADTSLSPLPVPGEPSKASSGRASLSMESASAAVMHVPLRYQRLSAQSNDSADSGSMQDGMQGEMSDVDSSSSKISSPLSSLLPAAGGPQITVQRLVSSGIGRIFFRICCEGLGARTRYFCPFALQLAPDAGSHTVVSLQENPRGGSVSSRAQGLLVTFESFIRLLRILSDGAPEQRVDLAFKFFTHTKVLQWRSALTSGGFETQADPALSTADLPISPRAAAAAGAVISATPLTSAAVPLRSSMPAATGGEAAAGGEAATGGANNTRVDRHKCAAQHGWSLPHLTAAHSHQHNAPNNNNNNNNNSTREPPAACVQCGVTQSSPQTPLRLSEQLRTTADCSRVSHCDLVYGFLILRRYFSGASLSLPASAHVWRHTGDPCVFVTQQTEREGPEDTAGGDWGAARCAAVLFGEAEDVRESQAVRAVKMQDTANRRGGGAERKGKEGVGGHGQGGGSGPGEQSHTQSNTDSGNARNQDSAHAQKQDGGLPTATPSSTAQSNPSDPHGQDAKKNNERPSAGGSGELREAKSPGPPAHRSDIRFDGYLDSVLFHHCYHFDGFSRNTGAGLGTASDVSPSISGQGSWDTAEGGSQKTTADGYFWSAECGNVFRVRAGNTEPMGVPDSGQTHPSDTGADQRSLTNDQNPPAIGPSHPVRALNPSLPSAPAPSGGHACEPEVMSMREFFGQIDPSLTGGTASQAKSAARGLFGYLGRGAKARQQILEARGFATMIFDKVGLKGGVVPVTGSAQQRRDGISIPRVADGTGGTTPPGALSGTPRVSTAHTQRSAEQGVVADRFGMRGTVALNFQQFSSYVSLHPFTLSFFGLHLNDLGAPIPAGGDPEPASHSGSSREQDDMMMPPMPSHMSSLRPLSRRESDQVPQNAAMFEPTEEDPVPPEGAKTKKSSKFKSPLTMARVANVLKKLIPRFGKKKVSSEPKKSSEPSASNSSEAEHSRKRGATVRSGVPSRTGKGLERSASYDQEGKRGVEGRSTFSVTGGALKESARGGGGSRSGGGGGGGGGGASNGGGTSGNRSSQTQKTNDKSRRSTDQLAHALWTAPGDEVF